MRRPTSRSGRSTTLAAGCVTLWFVPWCAKWFVCTSCCDGACCLQLRLAGTHALGRRGAGGAKLNAAKHAHHSLHHIAQIWVEFAGMPGQNERDLLTAAVHAWFAVAKMGGFNSQNLQARLPQPAWCFVVVVVVVSDTPAPATPGGRTLPHTLCFRVVATPLRRGCCSAGWGSLRC